MRALLAVVLSPLALMTLVEVAEAQSGPPGQCGPCGPTAMPEPMTPMAVVVAAPEPWEAHRFSVGLRMSGLNVDDPAVGDEGQAFTTGGLVARYRVTRRLELELALEHGTQQVEGMATDLELTAGTASLLFHMRPQARWDWYLLGGLGANDRRLHDAPDEAADRRAHVALGAGVERRFEHLVLGVEVRGLVFGERKEDGGTAAAAAAGEEEGVGGAQLSLAAGWSF